MPLNEEGFPGRPSQPLPPTSPTPPPSWDVAVQHEIDGAQTVLDDVEVRDLDDAGRTAYAAAAAGIAQAYALHALGRLVEDLSGEVNGVTVAIDEVESAVITVAGLIRTPPWQRAAAALAVLAVIALLALNAWVGAR